MATPTTQLGSTELTVELSYPDGRRAGEAITVQLVSSNTGVVAERYTDTQGRVTFQYVRSGLYMIKVQGSNIKSTTSEGFNIAGFATFQHQYIRVEPADANGAPNFPGGVVSDNELKIPKKARKEFEMGNDAVDKGQRDLALQHYTKATELYPQYAMAYNNLAALYMQAKDLTRADELLKKALEADPNLGWTLANVVKLKIAEKKYDEALPVLTKALARDPNSTEFLFLMCKTQFLLTNYDESLIYARKVYSASHQGFELAHIVAGRSLELRGQPDEARVEYEKLLSESPSAPEAVEARKSVARLEKPQAKKN